MNLHRVAPPPVVCRPSLVPEPRGTPEGPRHYLLTNLAQVTELRGVTCSADVLLVCSEKHKHVKSGNIQESGGEGALFRHKGPSSAAPLASRLSGSRTW
ncbi:hypothetical protein E2C01_088957 [Portunus trituberculatus]|uniref:Uncharacterized protein n=1 Tax=Portunus trituberculatus TaxID=210409 RepID=A0A5B7JHU8_PORTR|nr:hypothetical protein [Portunus trituberculatus]